MPELPEVEVTRRGLLPHLTGRKILELQASGKKLRHNLPEDELNARLIGTTIVTVARRAKYILMPLESGELLIFHLGMTGRLGIFQANSPCAKHDHLILHLDDGFELRFNDTRRFGAIYLLDRKEAGLAEEVFFNTTGPEPLGTECSPSYLYSRANNCQQAVKTFIMNSSIIAGVGNIYANESLFDASIHPETPASALSLKQWTQLLGSIQRILNWAIDCGGSTISDFLGASGESGYFQANFRVYNKTDANCPKCEQSQIQRKIINGRASFFCPACQRKYKPRKKRSTKRKG